MIVPFGFDIKENCIICASSLFHYQCILVTMHSIVKNKKHQKSKWLRLCL